MNEVLSAPGLHRTRLNHTPASFTMPGGHRKMCDICHRVNLFTLYNQQLVRYFETGVVTIPIPNASSRSLSNAVDAPKYCPSSQGRIAVRLIRHAAQVHLNTFTPARRPQWGP